MMAEDPGGSRKRPINVSHRRGSVSDQFHYRTDNIKVNRVIFTPTSGMIIRWDLIMCFVLVYTAFATPYELAYLETKLDTLFIINRICDVIFFVDIYVNFNLAYVNNKGVLEDLTMTVRRHYLRTWFLLDFVSTIPIDLITFVSERRLDNQLVETLNTTNTTMVTADQNSGQTNVKLLRLLKVVKLIKLIRVLKLIKTLGRSVNSMKSTKVFTMLASAIRLTNALEALLKYFFLTMITIHWCACFWRICPDFIGEDVTWMTEMGLDSETTPPAELYLLSFEFSLFALVMGYGAVEPANPHERDAAILVMIVAGSVYTYVVGGICSILSALDPITAQYRQSMDLLGQWCQENNFPAQLAMTMNQYFTFSKTMFRQRMYKEVVDVLAPSLRAQAAHYTHKRWLRMIPFFHAPHKQERNAFVLELSLIMGAESFPPEDYIYIYGQDADRMYILSKGIARKGQVVIANPGSFWGQEMLMPYAVCRQTVHSITMVSCRTLRREALMDLFRRKRRAFPDTVKLIRREVTRQRFRNAIRQLGRSVVLIRKETHARMTSEQIQQYKDELIKKGKGLAPKTTGDPYPGLSKQDVDPSDLEQKAKIKMWERVTEGRATEADRLLLRDMADPDRASAEKAPDPFAVSGEEEPALAIKEDATIAIATSNAKGTLPLGSPKPTTPLVPEQLSPIRKQAEEVTVVRLDGIPKNFQTAPYSGEYVRRHKLAGSSLEQQRYAYEGKRGWLWYNSAKSQWLAGPKAAVGTGRGHMFACDRKATSPHEVDPEVLWTVWQKGEWENVKTLTISAVSQPEDRHVVGAESEIGSLRGSAVPAPIAVAQPHIGAEAYSGAVAGRLQATLASITASMQKKEARAQKLLQGVERKLHGNETRALKMLTEIEDRVKRLEHSITAPGV